METLMNRRTALVALTSLAAAAVLPACGFRLRGSGGQSRLPFQSVHVRGGDSVLVTNLRRIIQASDTALVNDPKEAEATIEVLSETRDRAAPTLNTQGRIREFSLYYRASFRVIDAKGMELLPPTEISLRRDISYNESQAIAKEREEEMLYQDMQLDAVQQILRRVAALR